MREERGPITGDVVVYESFTIWGSVGGNVKVIAGGKLYLRGIVHGDLTVEAGGRVHIYGSVTGNLVVREDGKVIHSGVLAGDVVNQGGRVFIDADATVEGKLKTRRGETKVATKHRPTNE